MSLLKVRNLRTGFQTSYGYSPAVTGVDFDIEEGEAVALVGESGCGKSVTSLSLMRLLQIPPAKIEADELEFDGQNILELSDNQMRKVRGNAMSMIFQEPMTSLNPLIKVGDQIAESAIMHMGMCKREAHLHAIDMLKKVGIPDPEQRVNNFPHQMSGGMRQRVMIAIAMSCRPKLLIADEPTTALDVTIQAQILDLIGKLQREENMAVLLITHNLGIVAEYTEKVMVMYAGQIVEKADVHEIYHKPSHPYTLGLMTSIPSAGEKVERLNVIEGVVPSPMFYSDYCRFAPRCPYATEKCRTVAPELVDLGGGHLCRCHFPLNQQED